MLSHKKYIYPNIERWIDLNCHGSISLFAETCGLTVSTVARWMSGGTARPRKDSIDLILERTGMTYEEAFKTDQEH